MNKDKLPAIKPKPPTEITWTKIFRFDDGDATVVVNVSDTNIKFQWQIIVNGDASEWYSYYQGILSHRGYCVATAYWNGTFEEFVPFTLAYGSPTC